MRESGKAGSERLDVNADATSDISLISHLMRRAGFGASRVELEGYAAKGYEAVVDDLVHPERFADVETDIIERFTHGRRRQGDWVYRMVNTKRPLQEKMALFFHHIFATADYKSDNPQASHTQIDMFRRHCMSDVGTILTDLSKDPAMLFWLDNNENHKDEPNENYGRELLELFSMGVGNYTEPDVKAAAQAFTGWTFKTNIPGKIYPSHFVYRHDDHDNGVKSFLGESGRLNGEHIVESIVRQPATARFLSRHLYTFFVADEPAVSAWGEIPPRDSEAIDTLVDAYFESGGEFRHTLTVLFNSDFFKNSQYQRVKSPTEMVVGIVKLIGTYDLPDPRFSHYGGASGSMGQRLMNPDTVEGWNTGKGWIDGGTLNERVNFAVNELNDTTSPGVQHLIDELSSLSAPVGPHTFVDRCLDFVGPLPVGDDTRAGLLKQANADGDLRFDTDSDRQTTGQRTAHMLKLIVSAREYQFG